MSERVPDLLVEQLALGELAPETARRVRAQLQEDDDPRLARLEASDAEILDMHPPEVMARRIRNRLERVDAAPSRGRLGWWFLTVTVAAAAAALVAWIVSGPEALVLEPTGIDGDKVAIGPPKPQTTGTVVDPTHGGDRIKGPGEPRLIIKKRVGGRNEQLAHKAHVAEGDLLTIEYRADGTPHGVIVSLDGAGVVSLHFPNDETDSTALKPNGTVQLDFPFELDDAPDFEHFFFFTSEEPLDPRAVMEIVRKGEQPDDIVEIELVR